MQWNLVTGFISKMITYKEIKKLKNMLGKRINAKGEWNRLELSNKTKNPIKRGKIYYLKNASTWKELRYSKLISSRTNITSRGE